MACCAIKHCKNYSTKKDIPKKTFHLFPRDTNLSNRWADIVRESRNESCWKPNTWSCICSDHFSVDDKYITKSGHQRIKTGAVPSQALVLSSKNDDTEGSESVEDHECSAKTPTTKKRSRTAANKLKPDGNSETIQLPEPKEIITTVYKYLQTEFENLKNNISSGCDLTPLGNVLKRTAEATGVTEQIVTALLDEEKRPLKSTHKTVKRKRTKSSHCFENMSPIKEESISEEETKDSQTNDGENAQKSHKLLTVKLKIEEDEKDHRNDVQEKLRVDIELISCETESAVLNLLSTHSDETDEPMDSDYQQTNSAVQHLLSSELNEMEEGSNDTEYCQSTSAVCHTPPDAVHHPVKTELYDDD